MKKDPADYTPGERKFADLVAALKAGKPNAYTYRVNSAVTKDGDFVIGLTYHNDRQYYSASAIEIDGVRDNGKVCSWDAEGGALEGDLSDLLLASVHSSVRTV
ncbi:hypothetical protein BTW00_02185 [Psychrobacter sp. C 20.9]|uniref:hypothetical protein n=1 Tax=Psychrobacter sp. C 20.9 TaxID=1926477 RepID=UPI000946A9BB|nr:hypothetical protein [Psychrobacter sp. C 20.9]OLF37990.1 hypothetical protein BTW00_02185 [Psychrobacter sp. C 20.9]